MPKLLKSQGEEAEQRDMRNYKQYNPILTITLQSQILLQSSAIRAEDLVEGYKELERGLRSAQSPQLSCNPDHVPFQADQNAHPVHIQ